MTVNSIIRTAAIVVGTMFVVRRVQPLNNLING